MAALHAAFWGWHDDVGLTPLRRRYLMFSPQVAAREAARGSGQLVPQVMAEGWRRLPDAVAGDGRGRAAAPRGSRAPGGRARAGAPHPGPRRLEGGQSGHPSRRADGAPGLRGSPRRGVTAGRPVVVPGPQLGPAARVQGLRARVVPSVPRVRGSRHLVVVGRCRGARAARLACCSSGGRRRWADRGRSCRGGSGGPFGAPGLVHDPGAGPPAS